MLERALSNRRLYLVKWCTSDRLPQSIQKNLNDDNYCGLPLGRQQQHSVRRVKDMCARHKRVLIDECTMSYSTEQAGLVTVLLCNTMWAVVKYESDIFLLAKVEESLLHCTLFNVDIVAFVT